MSKTEHLHLFAGYGIEMEYMIVDRKTLGVKPICDRIVPLEGEIFRGDMAWSNELVMHVVEMKTNGPTSDLRTLDRRFLGEVKALNELLAAHDAMLLPTAMHPFFDPNLETKLWVHDNAEIYAAYDRIFSCKGHGWSNLQSVHVNLPFYDDVEFGKLHAAVRFALPILPAIAASSPIFDGKPSGYMDSRLEFYVKNQQAIPEITGGVIPERAFSRAEYDQLIWQKIYRAIKPHDPDLILQDEWLNSRGAIARFQRHAIEIRVLDIQESPQADLAVIAAVISLVRALTDGLFATEDVLRGWSEDALRPHFFACAKDGDQAVIKDGAYLNAYGLNRASATAAELWRHIAERLVWEGDRYPLASRKGDFALILEEGCLARRIMKALGSRTDKGAIERVYRRLAQILAAGATATSSSL